MIAWYKLFNVHMRNPRYLAAMGTAFFFLFCSLIFNFYIGMYVQHHASSSVTDIILSNIPVFDLDEFFVYGSIALVAFITVVCFWKPQRAPYTVKSIALFVVIRAIFTSLTHIGPFPNHVIFDPASFINDFSFGSDLFFSGHTGLPFLIALIFWKEKPVRYFFIGLSASFAVIVLLAHLHYSIDVLAAFFITYSIYHITLKVFKNEFVIPTTS